MRPFQATIHTLVAEHRRSIATSVRTARRSLVLGAVLALGSAITVLATTNTPPTITGVNLSTSVANEGDTVTVSATFTDPDAADTHSALIFWPDGTKQKVEIPAGQLSFQASHKLLDNKGSTFVLDLRDRQLPIHSNDNTEGLGKDSESRPLTVNNVPPTFAHNVTVEKVRNAPGKIVIQGDLVDPGADAVSVAANWGDGVALKAEGQACAMTGRRSFKCEHTYPVPPFGQKSYTIKLTTRDDDGGQTEVSKSVTLP